MSTTVDNTSRQQVDTGSTTVTTVDKTSTKVDMGSTTVTTVDKRSTTVDKSTNGAQPRYMGGKALKGMQGRQGGHGKLSARIITAGGRAGQLHPAWLCMEGEVPTGFDEDVCTAVLAAIHRV